MLDGDQKMKEKNDQEKKEECYNLKKWEGVCENCEKEVKNNQYCLQCDPCDGLQPATRFTVHVRK